jgi:signal transduction histidine kinase
MRPTLEGMVSPPGAHVAQFYDDRAFPAVSIARHLATGLNSGSPAIVMATPPHAAAIARALGPGAVEVTWLDAVQTLGDVLVRARPDPARFERVIGEVVRRTTSNGDAVYVYGEMVDLLTRRGQLDAALELEDLWNRLAASYPLHLYCAYSLSGVNRAGDSTALDVICSRHETVTPAEGVVELESETGWWRTLAGLERPVAAADSVEPFQAALDRAWTNGGARDQLANIASHELRNPVHVLSLNVRAARTALDAGAPTASVRHHLESAEAQLARVGALLDRMLRSSGFLDGTVALRPTEFDLSDAVRSVLEAMKQRLATSNVLVDLRSVVGYWDRDRVEQILENLISHAITFGGGQPIRISLQEFPEFVYVSVCDTGIANDHDAPIRPASLPRPRDPSAFDFRLWAARQLTEAMGGTIATSRPSTNRFRLILTLPRGLERGEAGTATAMSA